MSDLSQFFGEDISNLGEQYKICSECNTAKPISNFSKSGKYLQSNCKECVSVAWKKYYAKNREKLLQNAKNYQESKKTLEEKKHSSKRKEREKEILELHEHRKRRCSICNKIKDYNLFPNDFSGKCFFNKKSYCKPCATEKWIKPRSKTEKYKFLKSVSDKKYNAKPDVLKKRREKLKEKYHTDTQFKLKVSIRARLNIHLRIKNVKRIDSCIDGLGCSVEELMKHLEEQFHANPDTGEIMTWENHAKKGWHIDHIKPLASFNLQNREEFEEACNYKNLQPLWWKDNLTKGDRT
jgi:hypothetical protein